MKLWVAKLGLKLKTDFIGLTLFNISKQLAQDTGLP